MREPYSGRHAAQKRNKVLPQQSLKGQCLGLMGALAAGRYKIFVLK